MFSSAQVPNLLCDALWGEKLSLIDVADCNSARHSAEMLLTSSDCKYLFIFYLTVSELPFLTILQFKWHFQDLDGRLLSSVPDHNNEDMNVKEHVKDDLNNCIFLQIQGIIMEENPGEQSGKEDPTVKI